MKSLFSLVLLFLMPVASFADAPEAWQLGFQDPATPIMQGIIDLHHDIVFFMILVLVFVLWMITRTLYHFHYKKNHNFLCGVICDRRLSKLGMG
jgi:cytochrome c oxidase subunit 2